MVLTDEQKKEKRRITDKKYYEKNKEKKKIYRDNNKERNKKYCTEYHKIYKKSPQRIKSRIISSWKHLGLIYEDYDSLYAHYLNANNCDECGVEFGKYGGGVGNWKCMDHCHETGAFRNFLCCSCNLRRG